MAKLEGREYTIKPLNMRKLPLLSGLLCCVPALFGQTQSPLGTPHAVPIREATIYVAPDQRSAKVGSVVRGREVAILETSGKFLHILIIAQGPNIPNTSGWILDKGIIRGNTPDGDKILYGEAVDSENEASKRRGRRGAAEDALRLYRRVYDYFPQSPLAGEAMFRSADIVWQLELADARSRPSAKEKDPYMRHQINEEAIKEVEKKFPHTKWADLAAYDLLDNKVCGDWQGDPKCPEKETELYENYVKDHPESPKAAEALYEAAWRQGALVDIYKTREDSGKAESARSKAIALTQRITTTFPNSDFAQRAVGLRYKLQQDIPTFGNASE